MTKLIFNADDFGYNEAVNFGIVKAYNEGLVRSTTLMANMPGFEHAVKMHKENPDLGIGVHLTLTCGQSITTNTTLTDENKNFITLQDLVSGIKIDLDELYLEWKAQIEKVLDYGIVPSHFDSHHHVHTFDNINKVFVRLANEYDMPVRGNFQVKNLVTTDYFDSKLEKVGETFTSQETIAKTFLDDIKQYETVEIMCHPAYISYSLYTNSSFAIPRIFQLEFLTNSEFSDYIKKNKNISLINFNDLER